MRTTLVIPDPVGRRAQRLAKKRQQTLSEFVSEAIEARLAKEENAVRDAPTPYRVEPQRMGRPAVDISDRNALQQAMDETP